MTTLRIAKDVLSKLPFLKQKGQQQNSETPTAKPKKTDETATAAEFKKGWVKHWRKHEAEEERAMREGMPYDQDWRTLNREWRKEHGSWPSPQY